MGELPSTRVQPSRPLLYLFVTKAAHIEVVTSLTTEAFLAALRRSIARRGKPDILFRQRYQLSRCCKWTSWNLQDNSIYITDGKGTGLFNHRRMQLEIHSTTWTSLRRIMGSSNKVHEVPSEKNNGFSYCHLRGTVHITCSNRGLSKFQTIVCLIWWFFQPNIFLSWTFSNW